MCMCSVDLLLYSMHARMAHDMGSSPRPHALALPCGLLCQVSAYLGDVIGAITLTGSAVAFAKLHGLVPSAPMNLPSETCMHARGACACECMGGMHPCTHPVRVKGHAFMGGMHIRMHAPMDLLSKLHEGGC